jgi:hypothetical protein
MNVSATAKFAPDGSPRKLTDGHKKTRMGSSLILLQRYNEHGEAFLSRIVTDETWVFHYTPESKAESVT